MSPTIFVEGGFRFFFFSREEPRPHVHVIGHGGEAKFWIEPEVSLAQQRGLNQRRVNVARRIVQEHLHEIRAAWQTHFGG